MPWYVLTGAPGSGKTAILRQLEQDGFIVVEEAATDVIALAHADGEAEPWASPGFADRIVALQLRRERLAAASHGCAPVFFDRSPVCTLALCRFLGHPVSPPLAAEVDRAVARASSRRRLRGGLARQAPLPSRRCTRRLTVSWVSG